MTETKNRTISEIAQEILKLWNLKKWNTGQLCAKPYLQAMFRITDISESYGQDNAADIIRYFLSNASTWRGEDAKRIKAELNSLLKKS